jgi:conjugative transposon TraN protein
MEIRVIIIALLLWLSLAAKTVMAQTPPFTLMGVGAQSVPVTVNKMTNLVFPVKIRKGIKVSREIQAQKVQGVENVIELKAIRKDFTPTNLSVFGVDGRLYTFDLQYAENPPVLRFQVVNVGTQSEVTPSVQLTGLPVDEVRLEGDAKQLSQRHGFLHLATENERMGLSLTGIYLKDSLLWFTVHVRNRSLIAYHPEYLRITITDKKKIKRTAAQGQEQVPVLWNLPPEIPGHSAQSFAVGFMPFTIAKDKKLIIQMAEQNGGRLLTLTIKPKVLLKARAIGK